SPNQENVVPGVVDLAVEVRHLEWASVGRLWGEIEAAARAACSSRGVALAIASVSDVAPMQTPDWLQQVIAAACEQVVLRTPALPSGAGHDASWIGRIAPAGMIFVRSRDGRSHCPEEYS